MFYFPLFFTGQTTPLTKLPIFISPIFQSAPLTKLSPIFLLLSYFPFPPTKLSRLFFQSIPLIKLSLEGKKPKMEGKSEIGGRT